MGKKLVERVIVKKDGTIIVRKRTLVKCTECGSVVTKAGKKQSVYPEVGRICCPACGMGSIGHPQEFVTIQAIKPRK